MQVRESVVPGCVEVLPAVHRDERCTFAKPFHASTFAALGMATEWKELFFSASARGVIRGLHFQVPPAAHAKLVCCIAGEAFDVVVDLRAGSPAYGGFATFHLTAEAMNAAFAPEGTAHGFAALTDAVVVAYAVSSEHDPACDTGLRWDSVPAIPWPFEAPIVSPRDAALPPFNGFASPFTFEVARA